MIASVHLVSGELLQTHYSTISGRTVRIIVLLATVAIPVPRTTVWPIGISRSVERTVCHVSSSVTRRRTERFSAPPRTSMSRSEEHTSELQSRGHLVCRLLLEIKTI